VLVNTLIPHYSLIMRFTTYSKYHPELADAVNLQGLLDQLGDFLLQSGFAGGTPSFWHDEGNEGERSLESLRQAILQALMDSGQLTNEMLKVLRGESTGDPERDRQVERDLSEVLDRIVQRLMDEGYLNVGQAPQVPQGYQSMFGPGGQAHSAAQQVQFNLTEKGIDFLGYKTLKSLLGSVGKSSFGAHDTPYLATGVEAEGVSKPYEFGDVLNLDVPATLTNAIAREGLGVPINIEYQDLMVSQSEYRSSAATVLMLDCSHSMILYGEDRFTPAKKVALALTHLIRTQFPGDSLRVVLFHDSAEEIPLSALAQAQVGPYHTNTAEGLKLARRILLAQKKDMRQIIMITDGKPSALTMPDGRIYVNSMGLDPQILQATYREVANCRRSGIMINTFMLARDRSLVEFVKQVASICKGKAYFTNTMTLGQFILMDFMKRKTRRVS
jgi:Ca-activated chloride channel family protein